MPIKVLFVCHGNIFRLYEEPQNYAAYHMHIDTITHSVTQNLKPTPINKRSTRSCECIFSLTCKLLDGRRIHHIRFPERSAGCLSCSSIIYKQNISSIKCKVKSFQGFRHFFQSSGLNICVNFSGLSIKHCSHIMFVFLFVEFNAYKNVVFVYLNKLNALTVAPSVIRIF